MSTRLEGAEHLEAELRAQREALLAERRKLEELRRRNKVLAESVVRGKAIYTTLCITCHGPDGKGRRSPDKKNLMLAPPLAGSRVEGTWLLLGEGCGLGEQLARRLEERGAEVAVVNAGPGFARLGEGGLRNRPGGGRGLRGSDSGAGP